MNVVRSQEEKEGLATRWVNASLDGLQSLSQKRFLLVGLLLLNLLAHLYRVGDGPGGFHAWREADTASVAENFFRESWNPLYPRVHMRGLGDGKVAQELPLYNWLSALAYQTLGFSHAWPRLFGILAACWLAFTVSRLGQFLGFSAFAQKVSAYALLCSPLLFFYSRKIMPDTLAVAVATSGMYFFLIWIRNGSTRHGFLSAILLSSAGMIRPQMLCIGLPMAAFLFRGSGLRWLRSPWLWIYGLAVLIPASVWYTHAMNLDLSVFYFGRPFLAVLAAIVTLEPLKRLFIEWPWQMWISMPAVWIFLWGLRSLPHRLFHATWFVGMYIVFLRFADQFGPHDYYTLLAVVPSALLVGWGASKAAESKRIVVKALILMTLLSMPFYTWFRIDQRYGERTDFQAIRSFADRHIPSSARIIAYEESPHILLYSLGRYGWSAQTGLPGVENRVRQTAKQGATHLAVETGEYDLGALGDLLDRPLGSVGGITLYRLRP